LVAH
jgi:hypothetical protein